jgi:protein-tyrosine phosphatase
METMNQPEPFVDIHCHLLPALDDGPAAWEDSLTMAEMAATDGIVTIVATPHQLGNYSQNTAEMIRTQTAWFQQMLGRMGIGLLLLPGADVRIDPDLPGKILSGKVLTLADRGRHVLLELPHEVYFPLDRLLRELRSAGLAGILSHPERNQSIINQPNILRTLVEEGCLLQVTAGSLVGLFGSKIQKFTESIVEQGFVDFVASDAHNIKSRTPVLSQAFDRVVELVGYDTAIDLFCRNPACVAAGRPVTPHGKARPKNHNSFSSNLVSDSTHQFVKFY